MTQQFKGLLCTGVTVQMHDDASTTSSPPTPIFNYHLEDVLMQLVPHHTVDQEVAACFITDDQ